MTPLAGFVIAIIAGWIVRDPRRAAAAVVVPFLAVMAAQSWILASGQGVSPPSTVTSWPGLIRYWAVQAIFLALALGIAAELSTLRRRRMPPDDGSAGSRPSHHAGLGRPGRPDRRVPRRLLLDSAPVSRMPRMATLAGAGLRRNAPVHRDLPRAQRRAFLGRRNASRELAAADKTTAAAGGGR